MGGLESQIVQEEKMSMLCTTISLPPDSLFPLFPVHPIQFLTLSLYFVQYIFPSSCLKFLTLSFFFPFCSVKERTHVYACDCSVEALERAKENLECADIEHVMERFHPFCCDFSTTEFPKWLACDTCRNKRLQKLLHHNSGTG